MRSFEIDGYGTGEPVAEIGDGGLPAHPGRRRDAAIPAYIRNVYGWAYLDRGNARLLDRDAVVSAILLGNYRRLRRAFLAEIAPGQSVLQAAHVYGGLIPEVARRLGPAGRLEVVDLVPLQAALARRKLRGFSNAIVRIGDAAEPRDRSFDVVGCFFLLHEVPDPVKRAVVDALLDQVAPGGRAVFVDYHAPAAWHPLRGAARILFARLEPFALSLWHHEIRDFASAAGDFRWETRTLFGGLYQKTVARRIVGGEGEG